MPEFTVILETATNFGIKVEAETVEAAIEEAQTEGVYGLCHQCCGGGMAHKTWWREEGDELREVAVENAKGETVWNGPTVTEERALYELHCLIDEVDALFPVERRPAQVEEVMILFRKRVEQLSQASAIPLPGMSES